VYIAVKEQKSSVDIGIQEVLLIAVLSLIVLGPDRLPTVARTLALWINRIKRSIGAIRKEIEEEIDADDIRQQIHNENILHGLGESTEQLQSGAHKTTQDFQSKEKNSESGESLK